MTKLDAQTVLDYEIIKQVKRKIGTQLDFIGYAFELYERYAAQRLVDAEQPIGCKEAFDRYYLGRYENIDSEFAANMWHSFQSAWEARANVREVGNREAELESCLIDAGQILNAIRAKDGTWGDFASMYFDSVCDQINRLLGGDWLRAMWKRDAKRNQIEGDQS